jgi:cbb3-type cytochrome oxidase subunit 3
MDVPAMLSAAATVLFALVAAARVVFKFWREKRRDKKRKRPRK